MAAEITVADGRVTLSAPYHPDLPARAKSLGGRWHSASKSWSFDARDEERVRALAVEVYGAVEGDETAVVSLRVKLSGSYDEVYAGDDSVWVAGREIARRLGRDMPVQLGRGVVVVDGNFSTSAGSRKSPAVMRGGPHVVLELRDVPTPLAHAAVAEHGAAVWIADDSDSAVADAQAEVDRLKVKLVAALDRLATAHAKALEA